MSSSALVAASLVAAPLLALAATGARRHLLLAHVDGPSMEPALPAGARVLARRTRHLRRGTVVLLRFPAGEAPDDGHLLLKRVVALPGDRLAPGWAEPDIARLGGRTVPTGHLVVLGDNRAVSWDSRHFGLLTADRVVGTLFGPTSTAPPSSLVLRLS